MNLTKLYCIKDIVSGLRITGLLEIPNDGVAMQSFKKFLDDKSEDEKKLYQLFQIAIVEDDFHLKADTVLVADGTNVCERLETFIKYASHHSEE